MTTHSTQAAGDPARARPAILVWSADPARAAPLIETLAEGYRLETSARLPEPGALNGEAGAARPVLLLFQNPVRMLTRLMARGTAPAEALSSWRGQARAILALSRRDRRRVQVIDLAAALAHRPAFAAHFDLSDAPAADDTPNDAPARSNAPPDMFLTLLAERLLLGDGEARALKAELAAVAIDLSGQDAAAPDSLAGAYHAWRDMQDALEARAALSAEMDALGSDLAKSRDANELLQAQNRYMQEELEKLAARRAELEETAASVTRLNTRLADKAASLAALDTAYARLEGVQEQLAADKARTEAALTRARADLGAEQAALQRVLTSRTWRLTAPLRTLRALFARAGRS